MSADTEPTTEPGETPAPVVDEADRVPPKRFASEDDIDDTTMQQEVLLPMMNRWVIVRILEGPEAASLEFLPDVMGYTKLIERAALAAQTRRDDGGDPDPRLGVDEMEFAEQNGVYLAAVAHRAIRHPEASDVPVACPDCKNHEHIRSLWPLSKTKRLHQVDLSVVIDVALSAGVASQMRPFSTGETPQDSSTPATTGA